MLKPWADLGVDETDGVGLVFVAAVRDVAGLDAVDEQFVAVRSLVTANDDMVSHRSNLPARSRLMGFR